LLPKLLHKGKPDHDGKIRAQRKPSANLEFSNYQSTEQCSTILVQCGNKQSLFCFAQRQEILSSIALFRTSLCDICAMCANGLVGGAQLVRFEKQNPGLAPTPQNGIKTYIQK